MGNSVSRQDVLQVLARITRRSPADIQPHLTLVTLGVDASFGLSAISNLLRKKSGKTIASLKLDMTVERLIAQVCDASASPVETALPSTAEALPTPPPIETPAAPSPDRGDYVPTPFPLLMPANVGIGLDIQDISVLPVVDDMRTDDFYISHFHAEEISGAILHPEPRAHLCGIFCAKEAAKKAHPALLNLSFLDFRVGSAPSGRPFIEVISGQDKSLPKFQTLQISISHSSQYAAATCLAIWG